MHYHAEFVIDEMLINGDNHEDILRVALKKFNEHYEYEDEDGYRNPYAFYDYFVIGGRFSGSHILCEIDTGPFVEWCREEGVTISAVVRGKQQLDPPEQAEKVDAKWREMFPGCGKHALIFDHSGQGLGQFDITKLKEVNLALKCCTFGVISSGHDGKPSLKYLLHDSYWNGVCHQAVDWNGSFWLGISNFRDRLKDLGGPNMNIDDSEWEVVTVDYHR